MNRPKPHVPNQHPWSTEAAQLMHLTCIRGVPTLRTTCQIPILALLVCVLSACSDRACSSVTQQGRPRAAARVAASGSADKDLAQSDKARRQAAEARAAAEARRKELERLDLEYPNHGVVEALRLAIRPRPEEGAEPVVGWVRSGAKLRLKPKAVATPNCKSGWHQTYPKGWVCLGQGVTRLRRPIPRDALGSRLPDAPLPYRYFFVKGLFVPEFHRLPTGKERQAADAFARRYLALRKAEKQERAQKLLDGELTEDPTEPQKPRVVRRYFERGFYVAGSGFAERSGRQYVETPWGSFVQHANLLEREPPVFSGVQLGAELRLPVAFARRDAFPMIKRERKDGSVRFVRDRDREPYARHQLLLDWRGTENYGKYDMHRLEDGHYLRSWFVGVARQKEKLPWGVKEGEPWVHIDLSEQTLVLYEGRTPTYATLVSTGLSQHETPTGTFRIKKKFATATMSALGPEAGDDQYRIEDVPWTQYFSGAIALHGAFWHDRFGLRRSHGCVNLAPEDAHHVFMHTLPHVPDGWHGVSGEHKELRGSIVWVEE